MYQTRSALIDAVLEEIGKKEAGQTSSAEDVAAVDNRINAVLADLQARQGIYVADPGDVGPTGGNIEDAVFNQLVRVIGEYVAPKFGRSADQAVIEFSEGKLRVQQAGAYVPEPVKAEYF